MVAAGRPAVAPSPPAPKGLARYLAIHHPRAETVDEHVRPTDLLGLARSTGDARWLETYTPDLHDDRHVSLWEAESAEDVRIAMEEFHFFVESETAVFRVHEWGPDDVLASQTED